MLLVYLALAMSLFSMTLDEFAPSGTERGVGLLLRDDPPDRYIFGVAGTQFICPEGHLFICGIGGHVEKGESWIDCAQREAREEIGRKIRILSAQRTVFVSKENVTEEIECETEPKPAILYEMIHAPSTPKAGEMYRKVIFESVLEQGNFTLAISEIRALISLHVQQVLDCKRKPTSLEHLLQSGGRVIHPHPDLMSHTLLYPIGTPSALAEILAKQ